MSDFKDEVLPHRLTVAFDENGKPAGAMVEHRRRVTIDSVVVLDTPTPPQALTFEREGRETWIGDVLGAAFTDALTELEQLKAKVSVQEIELEDTKRDRDEKMGLLTQAVGHLQTLRSRVKADKK